MSVCRFSDDSDVYVFYDVMGGITCCACSLADSGYVHTNLADEGEMLAHLELHRKQGDQVPERAFERLRGAANE